MVKGIWYLKVGMTIWVLRLGLMHITSQSARTVITGNTSYIDTAANHHKIRAIAISAFTVERRAKKERRQSFEMWTKSAL